MVEGKGPLDLEKEVLNQGLCTSCGACVGICPYVKVVKDRVAVIEPCGITAGKCYDFCPRTPTDIAALDRMVFGAERPDYALGSYISIEMAQAADSEVRRHAQYGGVVSALAKYAMDVGETGAALLTKPFDHGLMPSAMVAQRSSQVLGCAMSNYVASPNLAALNLAKEHYATSMVGIPCQVTAVRKMQASTHESAAKGMKLVIGLFCTWALDYRGFYRFLKGQVDPAAIRRLDIPPPPANLLVANTGAGAVEFPLDDVRDFIKPTCSVCYDMTSELADISVGMVEGMDEWNTLIVRTEVGQRIVEKAKAVGAVSTMPLDEDRLDHLYEASVLKKQRAIAELVKRSGDESDLQYLLLSDRERRNLQ